MPDRLAAQYTTVSEAIPVNPLPFQSNVSSPAGEPLQTDRRLVIGAV